MHLIIDGYNLLHTDRSLTHLNSIRLQWERERLMDRLSTYRNLKHCEVTVVFDGWQEGWSKETREKRKGIEVIFSKLGEKADDVIKRLVKEKGSGAVVITSDREVVRFAQRIGATAIPSEQFQEKLEERSFQMREESPEEEERGMMKKKGPSRRLSKKEKKNRAASKKL